MSLDTYSLLLSVGALSVLIGAITLCSLYLLHKPTLDKVHRLKYEHIILTIAAVTLTATVFSLGYQHFYQTPVCELCWWQRIFLYPLSVIALVAVWYKTRESHLTMAILAAFGLYIACYHYYYHFQGFVLGNKLTLPCSYGGLLPACTDSPILVFGFITIPFLGIVVFSSVLLMCWLAYRVENERDI